MKAQFVFAVFLSTVLTLSTALPTLDKDIFWETTDDGKTVPAFLHDEFLKSDEILAVEDNVEFYQYVIGEGIDAGRKVTPGCADCTSKFVKGAPLILAAHGFGSNYKGGLGKRLLESFTKRNEPVNVVLINWAKFAVSPRYLFASNNVKKVGEYTAKLVDFLVEQGISSVDDTHFAGHSLGAHIANFISSNMKTGKLHRVYGLDPAMPLWNVKSESKRLSEHDGDLVVILHTSIGFLGMNKDCGHADFYPNSGKKQPGCDDNMFGSCSHGRCVDFLAESIIASNAFPACECGSWKDFEAGKCSCEQQVPMGWDTPLSTRGTFYLRTNGESPFSA